ncbi:MAG: hypothetical protein J0653_06875, partial [Deltaproteobacteria bacterium]|nr:hypothetical protein [Deltaproteobacteria bacterium]
DPAVLNPIFVAAVNFNSSKETYDVIWSHIPGTGSQTAYGDFNDKLFAGGAAKDVVDELQTVLTAENK